MKVYWAIPVLASILLLGAVAIGSSTQVFAGGGVPGSFHFKCYTPDFSPGPTEFGLKLTDQFGEEVATDILIPLDGFCASADKQTVDETFDDPFEFGHHVTSYEIIDGVAPNVEVLLTDQFSEEPIQFTVLQPTRLLVPAEKILGLGPGQEPPVEPKLFSHWKCYRIQGEPFDAQLVLTDQFGTTLHTRLNPVELCAPATKIITNPPEEDEEFPPEPDTPHLKCYSFAPQTLTIEARFVDQFLDTTIIDAGLDKLCVTVDKDPVPPPVCTPPPANLVSWWPGDGNTNDIADANNGALINVPNPFAAGKVGQAFNLNAGAGVGDERVQVADPLGAFNLDITGALTLDAWVSFIAVDGITGGIDNSPIVAKWGDGKFGTAGYGLFITEAGFPLFAVSPDGTIIIGALGPAPLGAGFHHVAGVANTGSSQLELYVDGVLVKTAVPFAGTIFANDIPLLIGGYNPTFTGLGAASSMRGLIDEVEIFDRALSQPEIQAIFDADSAGKCKELTPEIEKRLVSGPVEIGIYLPDETLYTFEISYTGPEALVVDTVPAEFEVLMVTTGDGTATFFETGKGKGKSSTKIVWDAPAGSSTLTVDIQTVKSPGHGKKTPDVFKPTSCGPLPINDGATAFEVDEDGELVLVEVTDPDTGQITLQRVVIVGPSNSLEVEAVEGAKPCTDG